MPYIIGVPKPIFQNVNRADIGDVVVFDLEEKTFDSPFVDTLPPEALNFLKNILKSSTKMFLSDGLARSFLQTNVILFGKYSLGFVQKGMQKLVNKCQKLLLLLLFKEEKTEWDRQLFVSQQKPSLQPFLHSVIGRDGVQYFERVGFVCNLFTRFLLLLFKFIEERLNARNIGMAIVDEFEREIDTMSTQRKFGDKNATVRDYLFVYKIIHA